MKISGYDADSEEDNDLEACNFNRNTRTMHTLVGATSEIHY